MSGLDAKRAKESVGEAVKCEWMHIAICIRPFNYMIDRDHAIIIDAEPTTAIRQAEVTAAKRMIERSREEFGLCPARLPADSGYGSAEMLGWLSCTSKGSSRTFRSLTSRAGRTGTFSRKDFT